MTTPAPPVVWNPHVAQPLAEMHTPAAAAVDTHLDNNLDAHLDAHLDALAQSSSYLRNLQTLSKVPRLPSRPHGVVPVSLATDDRFRFGSHVTRVRKSALPAGAIDRFAGEVYPFQAPYVPAVPGQDTRWLRRGSEITPVR